MTNNQLRPQKAKKGQPPRAKEQNATGGGTYPMSAGPLTVAPKAPPQKTATEAKSVPRGSASYSGPESKKPPKAPSTGDRGVA
jgi:hypothetical protein